MFDIGWTELLVVAVVAILVVGPKDLPRMLRTFGQTVGKMRRMANEFQSTFNEALREAERQADVADIKKTVEEVKKIDPVGDVKRLNPLNALDEEHDEAGVKTFQTPTPTVSPAPAEPAADAAPAPEAPASDAAAPSPDVAAPDAGGKA